ncbi:peptidylprolyl isomerase [Pseudomonadota bacterium]
MNIEKDKVVSVHYKVSSVEGQVVEDSFSGFPLVYLHGHGGMIEALEHELVGKAAGDKVSALIEKAYGEREEGRDMRVSIKRVMTEGKTKGKAKPKLMKGMMIYLESEHGPLPATVVKVGLKTVDVDTNHPYAGQDLNFDVEIVSVRDATPEELDHGHVHGEGGVDH